MASKKASKTASNDKPKLRLTVRHALTSIYIVLLFTAFPLFLSNYYSAARRDKFGFFIVLTVLAGLSVGIISIIDAFTKNNIYNRRLNIHRDPFKLSVTDIAFFSFILASIISTLTSGNIVHSLVGLTETSSGRNMGLIMLLLLLVSYLIISRFFFYKKYLFYTMLAGMAVVSFIAIMNYYYIDPLGLFKAYKNSSNYQTVLNDFTSTIGNKNYLSALICVALPFSFGISISMDDKIMRIIGHISTALQFMALIVATSDGGFFGCIIAFAIILIVICRDTKKLFRYFVGISVMLLSAKLLWLFDLSMGGSSKGYTSFSEFFIYHNSVFILLALSVILAVVMYYLDRRHGDKPLPSAVKTAVISVISLVAVILIALIVYFSLIDTKTELSGFMKFLRFDEKWGTHRGYFWIRSFDVFKDMNILQKLFGTGPESYYFSFSPYFGELLDKFGDSSTNAAHNVYINYLITHGIIGLGAYLAFVGSSIALTVKRAKENPLALVFLGVIIAYAAQDFVNIANPVNTPWFIAFIALSESTLLRANTTEEIKLRYEDS